jgi:hypothetical protein
MIDDSDADFFGIAGIATSGWVSVVLCLIALGLYFVACQNKDECAQAHCDVGKPVLAHHQCICETPARK